MWRAAAATGGRKARAAANARTAVIVRHRHPGIREKGRRESAEKDAQREITQETKKKKKKKKKRRRVATAGDQQTRGEACTTMSSTSPQRREHNPELR